MPNKILLIAFKFPPYVGVGGFRWSKLCKYLAQYGHEIHVVTVNWWQHGPNTLLDDVQHPNIHIHRIRSGYPHNLKTIRLRNRYLNAIKNRVLLYPFKLRFFDDEAQAWAHHLLSKCNELLEKHAIKTVIATGSPFQSNRWAARVKEMHPHISLIQDFRDEWADDITRNWSSRQRLQIRQWQESSVENANIVVAVTKGLLDLYLQGTNQKNGYVISNGYDPDSLPTKATCGTKPRYTFTHIGNLRTGREEPLQEFLTAVRTVYRQIPALKVNLVGDFGPETESRFADLIEHNVLHLHGYVTQGEAFEMVKQSSYALQFNARIYPYLVSTKIYEYGALQVPTFSCNYGGEIHDLIMQHSLGYSVHVEKENLVERLLQLENMTMQPFRYDVGSFAYPNLARRYSGLIQG